MYINKIIKQKIVFDLIFFADDTTISYSSNDKMISLYPVINHELLEVSNWFKDNKLSVNVGKTNYMIMGTPKMTSVDLSDQMTHLCNQILILFKMVQN